MLGTDHDMLENDVIPFSMFHFQISPAYTCNCITLNRLLTSTGTRVDGASRVHQLLLHNKQPSEDSTDSIAKQKPVNEMTKIPKSDQSQNTIREIKG
jgi:acyl-[acyl carrier protein]--UDP-N-acetylglucosamine O-acyltransferase